MCRACEWAKCQLYNLSSWLLLVIQNSLCNWSGVTLIQNPNWEVILKVTLCFTSPISSFNGIRKVSKEIWWSLGMKSWNSAFKCTRFESNYSRSYTLPTPAVLWAFLGLWTFEGFFFKGLEFGHQFWRCVCGSKLWLLQVLCQERDNKPKWWVGFCSETQKLSVWRSLVFLLGFLWFRVLYTLFNLLVPKLWRLLNLNDDNLPNSNWFLQT